MEFTSTFVTDNIGQPEAITVNKLCRRVRLRENAGSASQAFIIHAPVASSPGVTYAAGDEAVFCAPRGGFFVDGQVIGYVETVAGSITMAQEESLAPCSSY